MADCGCPYRIPSAGLGLQTLPAPQPQRRASRPTMGRWLWRVSEEWGGNFAQCCWGCSLHICFSEFFLNKGSGKIHGAAGGGGSATRATRGCPFLAPWLRRVELPSWRQPQPLTQTQQQSPGHVCWSRNKNDCVAQAQPSNCKMKAATSPRHGYIPR